MRILPALAVLAAFSNSLLSLCLGADEAAAIARIDQLVLEGLKKEGIAPNPDSDDEVFVRRIHLDLIGRIPTKSETLAFLKSEDPDKRNQLVDSLAGSDGYVSHFYNWFADLLRMRTSISGNNQSIGAGIAYERWIKDAIRASRPYDEVVRDLITASGSSWENPAIGYYLRDFGMPLDNLAMTTQVFLGTQIVCAQCHNHPFDAWTQMDYYHLAAFTYGMSGTNNHPVQERALGLLREKRATAGVKGGKAAKGKKKSGGLSAGEEGALRRASSEILFPLRFNNVNATDRQLKLPGDYQYDDAAPRSTVEPSTLFGQEAVVSESAHPVGVFADWLTSRENPRFAKVIANRLWKRAFGLGLIEPVDDFKDNTVAVNAPLMDYLEDLMLSLDFDLRAFQRILYKTRAYQREASREEPVAGSPHPFAGPILRRMSAEQIWDSLVAMTVADPDLPDPGRALYADKRLAEVQMIAEAIYDQKPGQYLANLRKVVEIQEELSVRIAEAEANVAAARESGDPDLIKQASAETRRIKDELDDRIEEVVYRDGLAKKLAGLTDAGQIEPAMKLAAPESEPVSIAGEHLVDELAATVLAGDRSFDEGMGALLGEETGGIIDQLISAIFEGREAALGEARELRRDQEQVEWKVKGKEDKTSYRTFDRFVRERMRRASELNQPAPAGHFLREFGQSDRELIENGSRDASVTQALAMLNGPILSAVTNRYSVLMRDMKGENFEDRLETVYLTMLSRRPTPEEVSVFREAWSADPEMATVSGIVWTMLNTRQFLFIQ